MTFYFKIFSPIVRFLLEFLGIPYEDRRYTSPQDWFGKDKPAFGANDVLANLPYIKDGEKVVYI